MRRLHPRPPAARVMHPKLREPRLLAQHHPPSEPIPLLIPPHIPRIDKMTQRQRHLRQRKHPQRPKPHHAHPHRQPPAIARHRYICLAIRRRLLPIIPRRIPPHNPPIRLPPPIRRKKHRRHPNHQPRKHPQPRKQRPSPDMKRRQRRISIRPRRTPQQPPRDSQVKRRPHPAHRICRPNLSQQPPDQRHIPMLIQPYPHRLRPQQPIRVKLSNPREKIHRPQLRPQNPYRPHRNAAAAAVILAPPPIHRPRPLHRQKRHQQTNKAHQIIMIQIRRLINQLDISEPNAKQPRAQPTVIPCHNAHRQPPQRPKMRVHPPPRQRPNPLQPVIPEMTLRLQIQRINPPMPPKPPHRHKRHHPKRHPRHRHRIPRHPPIPSPPHPHLAPQT